MVTTNDENLWNKMWSYKDHGKGYDAVYNKKHRDGFRWLHESFGSNYRMTEMQATIGRIQLKKIPYWHKKRLDSANKIWKSVDSCDAFIVQKTPKHMEHAAYKCYVYVNSENLKKDWNRDKIIKEINNLGVPCYSGSCSEAYLEKAFDGTDFKPKESLKVAKKTW
jgi:dTDP-4-amino-4,6-dideoxygalactose transaminase